MATDPLLVVLFWTCSALVGYAYLGYPVVIWALSRWFGRPPVAAPDPAPDGELPTVSLLLAAYNEGAVIEERLRNALTTDYPADRFEVVVGSDGSDDDTAEVVRRFAGRGVRLLDFAQNRGKSSVLNSLATEARGEILLMSDANTAIDAAAVRRLVRWFADPGVGAAIGRLVLVDPRTGRNADGLYWKYETILKRSERRLGGLLGANGAIYAIRKDLYEPIPPDTIVDDLVIPLLARLRTGCELVYDCDAVATEETAPDIAAEFHRRARIGAGGFQSIVRLRGLLHPQCGWIAFTFLSHKVLRWCCPFFLIGALVANLALVDRPVYRAFLAAQGVFYGASLLVPLMPARSGPLRLLRLAPLFVGMNAALLVGFYRWLRGSQKAAWRRTARVGEADGAVR